MKTDSDYLEFYVPLKIFSLIWRCHHCRWRAAKFRPTCMLGAQGVWAERDLYRTTSVNFSGLIWRTTPFSRLLRHTRGCGGRGIYFYPDPYGIPSQKIQICAASWQTYSAELFKEFKGVGIGQDLGFDYCMLGQRQER
jgi:hypothetical protein